MSISPTTPATFFDWNDELVTMPLVALTVLVHSLRLEIKFDEDLMGLGALERSRDLLSAPDFYPPHEILAHLEAVLKATKEHYGIEEHAGSA